MERGPWVLRDGDLWHTGHAHSVEELAAQPPLAARVTHIFSFPSCPLHACSQHIPCQSLAYLNGSLL